LNLIGNENIKFNGQLDDFAICDYLIWASAKNLLITNLVLDKCHPKRQMVRLLPVLGNLKVIVIHNDQFSFCDGFIEIIDVCPLLEELHLSKCNVLNDEAIAAIAANCPELREVYFPCLRMAKCTVADDSLVFMFLSCPKLQVVSLRGFANASNTVVAAMAANCPELRELTFGFMHTMLKDSLSSLRQTYAELMPRLVVLRLVQCCLEHNILKVILFNCHKLTLLDVSGNRCLCLHLLADFTQHCQQLTELNLSHLPYLTCDTVAAVIKELPRLEKLYIYQHHSFHKLPVPHQNAYGFSSYEDFLALNQMITHDTKLTVVGVNTWTLFESQKCMEELRKIETLSVVHDANDVWDPKWDNGYY
jgi:hypothetical protein